MFLLFPTFEANHHHTVMKAIIPFFTLTCLACTCCTNKRQQFLPQATPDKTIVLSNSKNDTTRYYIPECFLVDVQDFFEEREDTSVVMWAEHPVYGTDVQAVNVFVENPTHTSLTYGRDWYLYQWNGEKWIMPKIKGPDIAWQSDGFDNRRAPVRYCFRFPIGSYYHLSKGKYRIYKSFYAGRQEIALHAEFEIKSRYEHRENGWYRIIDNSTNSIAPYPIVTVKELINLRVDTDFYGKSVLVGNMGKHKRKAWADATEQAIGKRIGFVFNDSVLTSPQVNARIESGNFQISTLQEYDMESLYHQLIQEKRDSLDALFRANGWEKDTLFLNSLKSEEQDSIINSLDYTEAAAIVQGFEEENLHK